MEAVSALLVSCRFLRSLLAVWLGAAFAIFAFAAAMGLGSSPWLATLLTVAIAAGVAWLSWIRPVRLDEKAVSPILSIVFVLAVILSLIQLGRESVFMVNPAAVSYALGPTRGIGLVTSHSCVSSYFVAGQAVATEPNIYDEFKLYSFPQQDPNATRTARPIGSGYFDIDVYEYPPPFLLLPRALSIVAPQFLRFRMLWFALNGSLALIGLLAVTRMFDPDIGTRVLLLSPLVLGADVTVGTLQVGNLQLVVYSLAMLAMVFFSQRRDSQQTWSLGTEGRYAAGGAVLAFVTVSKMFPGMLVIYLIVRREWRAVAWTTGFCAAFLGISILDTGWTPYNAFLHHLPRLLSGESFAVFRRLTAVARNLSIPGLFFKLKVFGLPNGSFAVMKNVGTIYTLIVIAAAAVLAKRTLSRDQQPLIWLTILILASLRSPFLPEYGIFPVLWLLIILAARVAPTLRTLGFALIAFVVLNVTTTTFGSAPRLIAAMALLLQLVGAAIVALALRQRRESPVMQPVGVS